MMKVIVLAAIAITGTFGFGNKQVGPDGKLINVETPVTYPTQRTLTNLPCMIQGTELTKGECRNYRGGNNYMMPHPRNPSWYINCAAGGICQPCDPIRGVLEFNVGCKMCLRPGEDCPQAAPPASVTDCYDDGCPFCSSEFSYEAHALDLNYCRCIKGIPTCMPCPCGTYFDAATKCCAADPVRGRQCPQYGK